MQTDLKYSSGAGERILKEMRQEKQRDLAEERPSFRRRFFSFRPGRLGVAGLCLLLLPAFFSPLLANGKPLLMISATGQWSFPFLRFFFAPESAETLVECLFNYLLLFLPCVLILRKMIAARRCRRIMTAAAALLLLLPFLLIPQKMDRTDYRALGQKENAVLFFAPIAYGPNEIAGEPLMPPGRAHWLGCDEIGRDLAARLVSGARVSLAVGVLAALLALAIGIAVGLATGYFRGWFDLFAMRIVEMLLCFPTFLLLLILMAMLGERKIQQSIPLVIAVIGLTGWIGITLLVRGEVLKQSALPYIQSCIVAGMPVSRILFRHLLPNILPPVLISFTFAVAGAILSESSLSFLGFGVQPPTASWGNLLRQAFDDPMANWHLTFFPGAALFLAVISFHFLGEALRHVFAPEKQQ